MSMHEPKVNVKQVKQHVCFSKARTNAVIPQTTRAKDKEKALNIQLTIGYNFLALEIRSWKSLTIFQKQLNYLTLQRKKSN